MPTQVQFRRGDESQNNNFTGGSGEISVNTDNNSLRVHDGVNAGGHELAKSDLSNVVGIVTVGNVVIGTAGTDLLVNGNARITGILSIGTATITLDPTSNQINIGSQLSIDADAGRISVGSNELVNSSGDANFTGILTATNVSSSRIISSGPLSGGYYAEPHSVNNGNPIEIIVTVANKTSNHRYPSGVGKNKSYVFDGVEAPYLTFLPGKTYRFNESDSSAFSLGRIKFYIDEARTEEYTNGVTVSNIPKYTEILITEDTPSVLYYDVSSVVYSDAGNQIKIPSSGVTVGDWYRYSKQNELLTVGIGSTVLPQISTPGISIFDFLTPGTDYETLFYITDKSGTNRLAIYPTTPDTFGNALDLVFKVNESEAIITTFETTTGVSTNRSVMAILTDQNTIMYGGDSWMQASDSTGISLAGVSTNTMYLRRNGSFYGHFQAKVSAGGSFSTTIWDSLYVTGALSKGSGSFKIDHPLEDKKDTHYLVHSFIEGPKADLIYRGKVNLVNGTASVNIDEVSGMTEGTFSALCRDVQCFTTNESGWDQVRGAVNGNILTIECQNPNSIDNISWIVIGERKDKHMIDTDWTDENGKVIIEPEKTDDDPTISEISESEVAQLKPNSSRQL